MAGDHVAGEGRQEAPEVRQTGPPPYSRRTTYTVPQLAIDCEFTGTHEAPMSFDSGPETQRRRPPARAALVQNRHVSSTIALTAS